MPLPELNYKKILLIIGFILVSLALAFTIVWFFFLRDSQTQDIPPDFISGVDNIGQLPDSDIGRVARDPFDVIIDPTIDPRDIDLIDSVAQGGETRVLPVNTGRSLAPTPTRDGRDVAFYDPAKGQFFRISSNGQNKTLLTDEKFFGVSQVSWSESKTQAVLEFPDGANIIYDFNKRTSITLPKDSVDHQFAPGTDSIAFKTETPQASENWLIVTDSNGANPKFVEPVGKNGDQVQVAFSPGEEVVALFHKPVGASQEEVFLIGQEGENFKSFVVDGLGFKGKFSPDGQRLIYHVFAARDGFLPSLWVVDVKGQSIGFNKFDLGLQTWVDKCTFSNNSQVVYCAVPRSLEPNAGFIPGSENQTSDVFYRIDLETGLKKFIAEPVTSDGVLDVAISDMWLDETEQNLFFWDARTGGVYKIRLK